MPARKTDKTPNPVGRNPAKRGTAQGKAATTLPESMVTNKASPRRLPSATSRTSPHTH